MLSIAKLGPGHAQYYEQSVADGREDYYTGHGEDQGTYLGTGNADLGLSGELLHHDLSMLMRGRNPTTKQHWHHRQEQSKQQPRTLKLNDGTVLQRKPSQPVAAFDLTFSAPKSVSVMWALSDPATANQVKAAHTEAVRQAFDYLERVACVTRRGRGGKQHVRGEGFVAAAYLHRTSRAGDPQLHTHTIVMNATRATSRNKLGIASTRYSALHATLLYRESKTAGYLYQAALRAQLSRSLGVEWTDPVNGMAEIVGVDPAVCVLFSKRSEEINQQLAHTDGASARARNAAAIDTRAAKQYDIQPESLRERWHREAATIDTPPIDDAPSNNASTDGALPKEPETIEQIDARLAIDLFGDEGLTQHKTTFARRDVLRAVAESSGEGGSVTELEQRADRILDQAASLVTQLPPPDPIPQTAPRRGDGIILADGRADRVYSTNELLAAERYVLDSMVQRRDAHMARIDPARNANALAEISRRLDPDQTAMVRQITTSGHGVEVVVGIGGSGKTTSLHYANQLWTAAGIEVRGCTIADQAARNLHAGSGIESRTIATLRYWADPPPWAGKPQPERAFPPNGVLIVDESGMVPTRDLAFLADGCARHNTKLILIGDHRQLPEIEAGGSFRGLVHRYEAKSWVHRLITNRRQVDGWERSALAELRDGKLDKAIAAYAEQGRIHAGSEPLELRKQLVSDWLTARATNPEVAMIAYTRADVAILNQLARTHLDGAGELGRKRRTFAGREFAVGDEVLCLRNNRHLGVSNGTRGHIANLNSTSVTIQTTDGHRVSLDRDYLHDGGLTYGYAATGHKSQGRTVDGDAYVLASSYLRREWLYVAMSRARIESHVYVDVPHKDLDTGRALTPQQQQHTAILTIYELARRSEQHTLATDHTAAANLTIADLNELALRDNLTPTQRDRIDVERSKRLGQLRDQLTSNPPHYLLPAIGSIPLDPKKRERWIRNALRLEQYRNKHALTESAMTRARCNKVLGRTRQQRRGRGR